MPAQPKPECPHPEKRRHTSRANAEKERDALERDTGIHLNLVAYRCVCGKWHIGRRSKSPKLERQLKRALRAGRASSTRTRRPR